MSTGGVPVESSYLTTTSILLCLARVSPLIVTTLCLKGSYDSVALAGFPARCGQVVSQIEVVFHAFLVRLWRLFLFPLAFFLSSSSPNGPRGKTQRRRRRVFGKQGTSNISLYGFPKCVTCHEHGVGWVKEINNGGQGSVLYGRSLHARERKMKSSQTGREACYPTPLMPTAFTLEVVCQRKVFSRNGICSPLYLRHLASSVMRDSLSQSCVLLFPNICSSLLVPLVDPPHFQKRKVFNQ